MNHTDTDTDTNAHHWDGWNLKRLRAENGLIAVKLGSPNPDLDHLQYSEDPTHDHHHHAAQRLASSGLISMRLLNSQPTTRTEQLSLRSKTLTALVVTLPESPDTIAVAVHPTGHPCAKSLLRLLRRCAPKPPRKPTPTPTSEPREKENDQ